MPGIMPYVLAQCIAVGWPWIPKAAEVILKIAEVAMQKEFAFIVDGTWLQLVCVNA